MLMYEKIKERCDLAVIYAQDGAYASAARVLRDIAMETDHHAKCIDQWEASDLAATDNRDD